MTDLRELAPEDARRLTDRIKIAIEGTWQMVEEAYLTRAWAALGYSTWDEYCTREFGTSRLRLPREERQEVVGSLRDAGLSTRAIAAATGLARNTVMKELAQTEPVDRPEMITSLDGRQRPATQSPRPAPAPVPDADPLGGSTWSPEPTTPASAAQPEPTVPKPTPVRKPPVNVVRTVIGALADIDRGRRSLDRIDLNRLTQQDAETRRMWAAGLNEHLDALHRVLASLKADS